MYILPIVIYPINDIIVLSTRERGNKYGISNHPVFKRNDRVDIHNATIKRQLLNDGMKKICIQRGWTARDLATFGYATGKVREYDKEKLDKEAEERYNKIKEEKYASGEWKRPKRKE